MKARMGIMRYSLPQSKNRIAAAKRKREDLDEDEDAEFDEVLRGMSQTSMECSKIGDERPLSGCALSPDGQLLATGGWSENTKLWEVPTVKRAAMLKGHTERVTGIAFHPDACKNMLPSGVNLGVGSIDRTAVAWSLEGEKLRTFEGHLDRLARVAFHPSGAYLGTASFDKTWRLWDVNTGIELLLQEGHSRAVYGIAFQQDGALAASCGLDALSRVWDMQTSMSVLALEGHVKAIRISRKDSDLALDEEEQSRLLSQNPVNLTIHGERVHGWEFVKIGFILAPLWFFTEYLSNATLALTSVASTTILSSTAGLFTLVFSTVLGHDSFNVSKAVAVIVSIT